MNEFRSCLKFIQKVFFQLFQRLFSVFFCDVFRYIARCAPQNITEKSAKITLSKSRNKI